jgi:hypothetical protein
MKLVVFTVAIFLLVVFSPAYSDVRPEHSGAWYNPLQSGHGLSIEVIDSERSIIFWYVYDLSGRPLFLYAEGINVGDQIQAKVFYFEGMIWGEFDPASNIRSEWGTMTIMFHDCHNATLEYDSTFLIDGEPFGAGQMSLHHLVSIDDLKCFDFPMTGIYFGRADLGNSMFGDPESKGGFAVVSENGTLSFLQGGIMLSGPMDFKENVDGRFSMKGNAFLENDDGVTFIGPFTGDGLYDPDRIRLFFTTTDAHAAGEILITKMSHLSNEPITLSKLARQWLVVSRLTHSVGLEHIGSDGAFVFTDQRGCIYDGKINIPNTENSLIEAFVEVSECDINSGSYTGYGAYFADESIWSRRDTIELILWNEEGLGLSLRFM